MLPIGKIKDFGAAQEPEFQPYAAVFTDRDGTQEIIMVVREGRNTIYDDSHTLYNKRAVKRIANPGIARDILNRLHPPEDAAPILDEAFIRKDERERVVDIVRHMLNGARQSLNKTEDRRDHKKGEIESLQWVLTAIELNTDIDTLKGGDGK